MTQKARRIAPPGLALLASDQPSGWVVIAGAGGVAVGAGVRGATGAVFSVVVVDGEAE